MATFEELWRAIDDLEDYLTDGVRRKHPEPPEPPARDAGPSTLGVPVERAAPAAAPGVSGKTAAPPELVGGREAAAAREVAAARAAASAAAASAAAASASAASASAASAAARTAASTDDRAERARALQQIATEIAACELCGLCRGRKRVVPGEGVLDPLVMVIGEGPGGDEDATGRPFVGKAGQYLDRWLAAIELSREKNAFIANVVKCRPPGNRDPLPGETSACRPYLDRQIDLIRPKIILTVGRISSGILIGLEVGIGKLRGSTYRYRGVPLIPTYHPSGVLRSPEYRAPVWEDLRRVRQLLDESLS